MGQSETANAVLLRERQGGGIITLTLNRPQQFNSLSEELLAALQTALDEIAADRSARCVVIAGAGRAYCAGHDLREMQATRRLDYYQALFARCGRLMQAIQNLPVPVLAKVHGLATAAGCQLVGACDLAIAAESARFAVSGINVGLFCATPAVALTRNVSPKRAFDLLVTGRFIDAATAADWGLINTAVPDAELDAAVAAKCAEIAAKSPAAIRHGKAMVYRQRLLALPEAYAYAGEVMARNLMEDDANEGIRAFLEKRAPVWKPL
jgi:enoyl-CoA hydratase/carnithine racemase